MSSTTLTPLYPRYSEVRQLLVLLEGVPKVRFRKLVSDIMDQTGTPQQTVDWTDPDTWIDERLSGDVASLAHHIWDGSGHTINPRHVRGSYYFINTHNLLAVDGNGYYELSGRSAAFHEGDVLVVRAIDEKEGIPQLLGILGTKTMAKRSDLLPEWTIFLKENTRYRSDASIKSVLRYRLRNLEERGMVRRDGIVYSITPAGLEYAAPMARPAHTPEEEDPLQAARRAISRHNRAELESLRQLLGAMPPYQFEHLVRDLLEEMGYEDVTVTKESGDRGVDVVATVQFGITTITEVVQVKRHQGTIGRPVIDQLRGALPYHGAIRGTLITLGSFSSGCAEAALFPGAAPISLIDGARLLELLVEHQIGIRKTPAILYEVDNDTFAITSETQKIEESLLDQDVGL